MIPSALILLLSVQKKWTPPYTVMTPPVEISALTNKMGSEEGGAYLTGTRLTFISKGEKNTCFLPDWLRLTFTQDVQNGVWAAQTDMKDWDHAFFNYRVGKTWKTFIGPRAPKFPTVATTLQGTVKTFPFASKALGESRDVTVYLPPVQGQKLNAIYMADGQSCEQFAKVLEPLILAKKVAPTAIIGLHAGEYKGTTSSYDMAQDFRAREYLKVADPDRFTAHLKFVADEVMPWAEAEFGLAADAKHRTLFGFSNGGAFAMSAVADRPELFGAVMPCSVAAFDRKDLEKTVTGKHLPKVFLAAGTLELFIANTSDVESILKHSNNRVRFDRYVSGHDQLMWQLALARDLPQIFPWHR